VTPVERISESGVAPSPVCAGGSWRCWPHSPAWQASVSPWRRWRHPRPEPPRPW